MALRDGVVDALWVHFHAALRGYYRDVEVEGAENVPHSGPVILAANHCNAFIDPLVVQYGLIRRVTVTAKGPLLRHPLVGPLMRLSGAVAFHRREDGPGDASREQTERDLELCRRRLAGGAVLCFFPEGKSHDDVRLRAFKSGVGRLAVDFVRADGDPGGLRVVPVGIVYEAKDRPRSRVLVRYGAALDVARWLAEHPGADGAALAREIESRVRALVVEFDDEAQASALGWAARMGAGGRSYAAVVREAARLREGDAVLIRTRPEFTAGRYARVEALRARLRERGIAPEEVFADARGARAVGSLLREAVALSTGLPFAAWGAWQNALPALAVYALARRRTALRDVRASNAVFASAIAFPSAYALRVLLARRRSFIPFGVARSLLWPAGALAALRFADRLARTTRRARALRRYALDPALRDELTAEARAVLESFRPGDRP